MASLAALVVELDCVVVEASLVSLGLIIEYNVGVSVGCRIIVGLVVVEIGTSTTVGLEVSSTKPLDSLTPSSPIETVGEPVPKICHSAGVGISDDVLSVGRLLVQIPSAFCAEHNPCRTLVLAKRQNTCVRYFEMVVRVNRVAVYVGPYQSYAIPPLPSLVK
jgi:hypothetical protein